MPRCPRCEHANAENARFCENCGGPLPASDDWARRLITVLSAEIALVSLGEGSPDEERSAPVLREVADKARRIIEGHGGKLAQTTGDELVATFGGRGSGLDDPIQAVLAALELVDVITKQTAASERRLFVSAKAAVSTGRVVTAGRDDPEDAARDLVALATSTRKMTQPGTVAVDVDSYESIAQEIDITEAPGLDGYRVHSVRPRVATHTSPLVGRDLELATIREAFERAVQERTVQIVTIVADGGGGKSRLALEATTHFAGVALASARCSGEGRTDPWAPIATILNELIAPNGDFATNLATTISLAPAEEHRLVEERLGALFGKVEESSSLQETFWAVRRLLELVAVQTPLVIVLDDLQWAAASMLELISYVGTMSRNAPILLLCMTRPDLLERNPNWPASGTTLSLRPLSDADLQKMLDAADAQLSDDAAGRLIDLAAGNPLFLEEGAAALVESDNAPLPATLEAVTAARLEKLPPRDRAIARIASVIGTDFPRSTMVALATEHEAEVTEALDSLVGRGILTRQEGMFVFKHGILQQAAYDTIPLGQRAELHESYATLLLEGPWRDDVTVGHHFEAAHRTRLALDPNDEGLHGLGTKGGELLAAAGERSLMLGDVSATISLLQRALALLPADHRWRPSFVIDLTHALIAAGRIEGAQQALGEIGTGLDESLQTRVRLEELVLFMARPSGEWVDRIQTEARKCLEVFERLNDPSGLCATYRVLAEIEWENLRFADAGVLMQQALEHALRGHLTREAEDAIAFLIAVEFWGPTHVAQAAERARGVMEQSAPRSVLGTKAKFRLGGLLGMQGHFDEARSLMSEAVETFKQLGMHLSAASSTQEIGITEMLANEPVRAEVILRSGYDTLLEMGGSRFLATIEAFLARALFEQGRIDEAYEFTVAAEKEGNEDPLLLLEWGPCRAKVLAEWGRLDEAEALARKALVLVKSSDNVFLRGNAMMDAAAVLQRVGNYDEAGVLLLQARDVFNAKGVVPLVMRVEAALEEIKKLRS